MKKLFILKSLLMLCALFGGVGSANAAAEEDFDYEWVKVNDLSTVQSDDIVVLVDLIDNGTALPNNDSDFKGVSVTLSGDKITSTVSNDIQWKVTKNNNDTYSFRRNSHSDLLYAQLTGSGAPKLNMGNGTTSEFSFGNYNGNGSTMSCSYDSKTYNLFWSPLTPGYKAEIHQTQPAGTYFSDFVLYKKTKKNYVKWKEVSFDNLSAGSTVVIVDKTTGLAMTNDKGDSKKPGTSAVELNADKDRIMGDVNNNIQWTVVTDGNNVQFKVGENNFLQYDTNAEEGKEKLSVGTVGEGKNNNFTGIANNCLRTAQINNKWYNVGLKNSFMSNSWEVKAEGDQGAVNDDIKNTLITFYEKVVSPQKKVTLKFNSNEYYADKATTSFLTLSLTCTGTNASNITWSSSDETVATVSGGEVTLLKRGTVTITARVTENPTYHDKASATCTVIIDNTSEATPGCKNRPFTVAQARELAAANNHTINIEGYGNVTITEGTSYYIQGIISKVGGGIFDMMGDMEIPGMDDMDFDMDDMGGMSIPGMTSSDGTCSYYISDDGTKDNHMKVVDGHGLIQENGGALSYGTLTSSALSPGDKVTVYGPLIYTEDTSIFSGMGGSSSEEPKYSSKVGAVNGMVEFTRGLVVIDNITDMKNHTQRNAGIPDLYTYNNQIVTGTVGTASYKSKDEEVIKFEEEGEGNNKHMVMKALKEGTVKVTVKVKVTVVADDPNTTDVNEEKSYTMKRSLMVTVTSRDKAPEGLKAGHYALVTNLEQLQDGDKIIIVGEEDSNSYIMKSEDSDMGGKGGVETTVNSQTIAANNVPASALELTLERGEGKTYDTTTYNFRFRNSNGEYLYASDKASDGNMGFDMSSLFGGNGAKLKFGTEAEQGDSLYANIIIRNFSQDYRGKIEFNIRDRKETKKQKNDQGQEVETEVDVKAKKYIKFTTKLDFDMSMFGGGGESGDFDISSLLGSFAMPAFSAYDIADGSGSDADGDGTEANKKHSYPRIYRWVPDDAFAIAVGESKWATLVSAFDVTLADNGVAYVVTNVADGKATLTKVTTSLKAGEPYLINAPETQGEVTLTKTTGATAPATNLLRVSNESTTGESGNSNVYVMGYKNATDGARFYKWTGGLLGKGRVYLPVQTTTTGAPSIAFAFSDATGIENAVKSEETREKIYYTLDGRRVEHPTKGLYIVNGKKLIIK